MDKQIQVIVFGTFGTPYGYNHSIVSQSEEASKLIHTFDLDTIAMTIFPDTKLYCIRKESFQNKIAISYGYYRYAKESNSARTGTFIGGALWSFDQLIKEDLAISVVTELVDDLMATNLNNGAFTVDHSKKMTLSKKPSGYSQLAANTRSIKPLISSASTKKDLVVYCPVSKEKLSKIIEQALDLLNRFDTIYFTNDEKVAEFVYKKGLFEVVDEKNFGKVVSEIIQEKKAIRSSFIKELREEKQRIQTEFNHYKSEFENNLEIQKSSHRENQKRIEGAQQKLSKIDKFASDFFQEIELKAKEFETVDVDVQVIKSRFQGAKGDFWRKVQEILVPESVKSVQVNPPVAPHSKPAIKVAPIFDNERTERYSNKEEKKRSTDKFFQISTFALLLLLFSTIVIYQFIVLPKYKKPASRDEVTSSNEKPVPSNDSAGIKDKKIESDKHHSDSKSEDENDANKDSKKAD